MPIFLRKKCSVLYLHVPKTGGSAIEQFFARNEFRTEYCDTGGPHSFNRFRRCSPQHLHAEPITAALRPARFDFVFMTVRNPLARIVSEYRMRLSGEGARPPALSEWLDQTFNRFAEDPYTGDNHIRPQSEFWLPNCEVYRQEDGYGPALVNRIEERLVTELEHRDIGQVNLAKATDPDSDEIKAIEPRVRQFYRQDYLTFGY
ncbi:MAG TPA: sulfotransferase family 2 domain-containing protein [Acetobacteraceae bacterium]|nr:sulfotransferase family 2 domain-containing protein [Acetobacteraceae bacterium]